jgi:predicted phosphate transport protein (TIGR00153 family)
LAFRLIPREEKFYADFQALADELQRGASTLEQMLAPDEPLWGKAEEIKEIEHKCDFLTHDIISRLNRTFVTPIDREDIYGLATQLDDIVDYIEEVADFMGLYRIEAPMEQSQALSEILVKSCEQLYGLPQNLRGFKDLEHYWIEIHRLENDGDRIYRDAVASLFADRVDPMVVIRWRDIFLRLERAIDATETAAHILEGIVIKNA